MPKKIYRDAVHNIIRLKTDTLGGKMLQALKNVGLQIAESVPLEVEESAAHYLPTKKRKTETSFEFSRFRESKFVNYFQNIVITIY